MDLTAVSLEIKTGAKVFVHTFGSRTGAIWGVFCIVYSGYEDRLPRRTPHLVGLFTATVFVLGATNTLHGLFFSNAHLVPRGTWTDLDYQVGPLLLVTVIPPYATQIVGNLLLVDHFSRTRNVYRKVTLVLLLAGVSMLFANALSYLRVLPLKPQTIAPLAFLFWGVLGILGFVSMQFFQALPLERALDRLGSRFKRLEPLARDLIVEEIDSGILILDAEYHVVDINGKAKAMLGTTGEIVGQRITDVVPVREYLTDVDSLESLDEHREQTWITTPDGEQRCYDVTISGIYDDGLIGRTVVIYDITEQKERDERLRARETELQTLKQVYSPFLRHNTATTSPSSAATPTGSVHTGTVPYRTARRRSWIDATPWSKRARKLESSTRSSGPLRIW